MKNFVTWSGTDALKFDPKKVEESYRVDGIAKNTLQI